MFTALQRQGRAVAPRGLPGREPLGPEARELRALVPGGARLARPLVEAVSAGAVSALASLEALGPRGGPALPRRGDRPARGGRHPRHDARARRRRHAHARLPVARRRGRRRAAPLARHDRARRRMAEMPYGGGKAVILGDPARDKTDALLTAYAGVLDAPGRPLPQRMRPGPRPRRTSRSWRALTPNISRTPPGARRSTRLGSPRWACSLGIEAAAERLEARGRRPARRRAGRGRGGRSARAAPGGAGSAAHAVATSTAARVSALAAELGLRWRSTPDAIYDVEADVFSPERGGRRPERRAPSRACAAARWWAGPTSSSWRSRTATPCTRAGILYAPDYVVNAGGLLSLLFETGQCDEAEVTERVRAIGPRLSALWAARGRERPAAAPRGRRAWSRSGWRAARGRERDEGRRSPGGATRLRRAGRGPGPAAAARVPARPGACGTSRRAALRGPHQVVRFDARGFGGSPPGDGLLTMERIADDAAALLDHLGIGQAVVCGLSMGGYAAFALVRRHAERLRGAGARGHARRPRTRPRRAQTRVRARGEGAASEGAAAAAEAYLPKLLGDTTHRERPAVVARVRDLIAGHSRRAASRTRWPAWPRARTRRRPCARSRVPTLVLCGAEDAITPPVRGGSDPARVSPAAGSRSCPRRGTCRTWRRPTRSDGRSRASSRASSLRP